MKKQRNDCEFCENFIQPIFKENGYDLFSNAKCNLGNLVRYQTPKKTNAWQGGYYTYCESYKLKE